MGEGVTHHGLFPFVASTLARSSHRYLTENCPDSALLREMGDLPQEMASALNADAVLSRMRTHIPLLETYISDVDSAEDELARFPAPWPDYEGKFVDHFEHWRDRINRVGGLFVERFVRESVTRDMVCEMLGAVLTPDVVSRIPTSPEWIERFHGSETYNILGNVVIDSVEEALSKPNLKATHAAVKPIIARLIRRSSRPELAEGIDEAIVQEAFTHRAVDLRNLADWVFDILFASYNVPISQLALDWLLKAVMAERNHDRVIEALSGFILDVLHRSFDPEETPWGVDPDLNILTVPEAAACMGLQPSSLHTHISKRKGTSSAVPVELRKVGRGRGTYVIHVDALDKWAEDHWRPRRKK